MGSSGITSITIRMSGGKFLSETGQPLAQTSINDLVFIDNFLVDTTELIVIVIFVAREDSFGIVWKRLFFHSQHNIL